MHNINELKSLTKTKINALAKELKIKGYTSLKNEDLIFQIMKQEARNEDKYLVRGILEILPEGYGFLRTKTYLISNNDIYVSHSQIRKFGLRTGDTVIGTIRLPKEGEKYGGLLRVEAVNYENPDTIRNRIQFEDLVPVYPDEKFKLEGGVKFNSTRIIDIISPIGKGQRGLIVAPPKAGKTTIIKEIANSITGNHPEVTMFILLIDERPEEVTDISRSVDAEVVASTFDEPIDNHIRISELVIEKAKRLVEQKRDVVILLDSITRLARAYNITTPSSGQTLSGGVNPIALYRPKKFFGSARNIENGGSLTIIATALIDTGSKMDNFIFEEFKGTGNMELVLDRKLFNIRLFPAIDIKKSSTRREDLLLDENHLMKTWVLRKIIEPLGEIDAMKLILKEVKDSENNEEFFKRMNDNAQE